MATGPKAQSPLPLSGGTYYALIWDTQGQIWNTSGTPAFEAYSAGNYTDYAVSMAEEGSSGHYSFSFPPEIESGAYRVSVCEQVAGSPVESDKVRAYGEEIWDVDQQTIGDWQRLVHKQAACSYQLGQQTKLRVQSGGPQLTPR